MSLNQKMVLFVALAFVFGSLFGYVAGLTRTGLLPQPKLSAMKSSANGLPPCELATLAYSNMARFNDQQGGKYQSLVMDWEERMNNACGYDYNSESGVEAW